ncbi:MAG TPA: DUF2272 domain-containing protein [Allosphingosinicella sp.]|nr:DUF2272 domain-containing protein [Allosphingosinicella sp.]
MAFTDDLIAVARREWTRWGGAVERLDGSLGGFSHPRMEAEPPFWTYVGEYWRSVNSDHDGRDAPAWSAAFISYCFAEAQAGSRFPYHGNHSHYVAQIDGGAFAGLSLLDPGASPPAPGDIVWAGRSGSDCRRPPADFASAKAELRRIRRGTADTFCSHCDIVTAIRPGEADVIGGNVKQAVTRTTYKLDTRGRIRDGRRNFIGVIRNAL